MFPLYSEEEKCIPIQLKLRPTTSSDHYVESKAELLSCSLTYFDVIQCSPKTVTAAGRVAVSKEVSEPVVAKEYQEDIELHIVRCDVAETIATATKLADTGQLQPTRDILHHCKARIKKSVAFGLPLARYFEETIDQSLSGLVSQSRYTEHGKPSMMNYSLSHYQQRSHGVSSQSSEKGGASCLSSRLSSDPYTNAKKSSMKFAYAQVHFDK